MDDHPPIFTEADKPTALQRSAAAHIEGAARLLNRTAVGATWFWTRVVRWLRRVEPEAFDQFRDPFDPKSWELAEAWWEAQRRYFIVVQRDRSWEELPDNLKNTFEEIAYDAMQTLREDG